VAAAEARREELIGLARELATCQKCPLAESRTNVVFGSGSANADLMFVGEAPGFHEDQQAKPFVGPAGKLLDDLLGEIGLNRKQCFIANVLKCRPPGNRDPQPVEIDACKGHLFRQIELIEPRVVCTLGNFATKLLSGRPDGITRVRGVPQVRTLAGRTVFLYPIFHPAAALRTPAMLERLREDFRKLPALLEQVPAVERPAPPPTPEPTPPPIPEPSPPPIPEPSPQPVPEPFPPAPELVGANSSEQQQLGLF
jgi:DNA polymerase